MRHCEIEIMVLLHKRSPHVKWTSLSNASGPTGTSKQLLFSINTFLLFLLRETKEFFLQFSFKLSDPRGGNAVARPPPPAMVPAPPKPVSF